METEKEKKENQAGVVLVMALIILSLVMVSVLAVSKIITGEIKVSLNTGNSIAAYYAAETGIEKALYRLKYAREGSDLSLFTGLESPDQKLITGQLTYRIVAARVTSTDFTVYNLTTTSPASVDIIDPSGNLPSSPWIGWGPDLNGTYSYGVGWKIVNCFPTHVNDRLEVTVNSFGANWSNFETKKKVAICSCIFGSNICKPELTAGNLSDTNYYRFSFRPLDSTVAELSFNLYEQVSEEGGKYPIGIFSEAKIISEGNYHNSRYPLQVRLPALSPLSNVFSYIIFSEEDIVKDF
jgi:hypothetical protein